MSKRVRTPQGASLRQALRLAFSADASGCTAGEIVEARDRHVATAGRLRRRDFLQRAAVLAAAGAWPALACARPVSKRPCAEPARIAIVGAGMAGLATRHQLAKLGLDATVYEASKRVGGRMFTAKELMGPATWAELGGEFVDTNHADIWALTRELGLELIDYAQPSEAALHAEAFFFEGRLRSLTEVVRELMPLVPGLRRDIASLPMQINWQTTDATARRLDGLSLAAYLDELGATGWVRTLIENCYESEMGLSPAEQSCLNFLLLIDPEVAKGQIKWFGDSDERYKVRGGNQGIPLALAARYHADLRLEHQLVAVRTASRGYSLRFADRREVEADYVVLTLPFSVLRTVDLTGLPMPAAKQRCINELGYGTNAKLLVGQRTHHWRARGFGGLVYADNGIPNGWDNAQLQTPAEGPAGLSILFGGAKAAAVAVGSERDQATRLLPSWEAVYPGCQAAFTGQVARMLWAAYPYAYGSYVCPKPGQYTTLLGWEQTPVGNVLFAGEHCGGDFAGYMNGAAQSGREAALEIGTRLGLAAASPSPG